MGKNKKKKPSKPAPKSTPPAVQPCKQCTISSSTVATSPKNRDRTRIGVGEEVTLTVNPGPATWEITSGPGGLIGSDEKGRVADATSVTYWARNDNGDPTNGVTISATGSCGTCTIKLTIVAPTDLTIVREPGTVLKHVQGRPTCGFLGRPYVVPTDVNFYNLEVREKDSHPKGTGCFSGPAIEEKWHGNYPEPDRASSPKGIDDYSTDLGSRVDAPDMIGGDDPGPLSTGVSEPFNPGTLTFPIVWQWRVHFMDTWYDFPTITEVIEIFASGRCTATKAGHSETCEVGDVSGAPVPLSKRAHPSAFAALVSSSQIMQRTIIREKLKVRQPDIYIDVEVDEYYVLDFHRFKEILAAAAPAKEQLRRQLDRVLGSQTLETLPADPTAAQAPAPQRKRRLPALKRLPPATKA